MIDFIKRLNLPNKLTLLRVVMVPLMCLFLSFQNNACQIIALLLFILASITDMMDGKIARRNNQITDFGKLLDPIADKLLVLSAMVFLVAQQRMSAAVCMIFIARELIISGFRLVAAADGKVIAAGKTGKYKTVVQMIAVCMSMVFMPMQATGAAVISAGFLAVLTQIVMWAALVLAVVSCVEYIVKNITVIDTTSI